MGYLRNTWYVAGWDHDVAPGALLRRVLLDEPVLLFRDSCNVVHALYDRCPHRFAPLSMGRHLGDSVQCGYHGLEFDGNGACIRNPHGNGAIPAAARVKNYPVMEKCSVIWI